MQDVSSRAAAPAAALAAARMCHIAQPGLLLACLSVALPVPDVSYLYSQYVGLQKTTCVVCCWLQVYELLHKNYVEDDDAMFR
jgi:hypothetical protein